MIDILLIKMAKQMEFADRFVEWITNRKKCATTRLRDEEDPSIVVGNWAMRVRLRGLKAIS